ncbi:MAG: AbrB/MazE/SpoVT family DNA-binding domain-containing protein, partial [Candidatus Baldrarchaeia archaeon]
MFIFYVSGDFNVGEIIVVIDDRGRVLIPSEYRKRLNLKSGSKLKLKIVKGNV